MNKGNSLADPILLRFKHPLPWHFLAHEFRVKHIVSSLGQHFPFYHLLHCMLRSVRTYATSAAIWGKESSPYKVQAQHAIPNIMNPPSFPQFYILHLHFLSNRKKGNENIEDKSKPDT